MRDSAGTWFDKKIVCMCVQLEESVTQENSLLELMTERVSYLAMLPTTGGSRQPGSAVGADGAEVIPFKQSPPFVHSSSSFSVTGSACMLQLHSCVHQQQTTPISVVVCVRVPVCDVPINNK